MNLKRDRRFDFTIVPILMSMILASFPAEARQGKQNSQEGTPQVTTIAPGQGVPELNAGVVNFAVEHMGKKIGNGECWTLAKEALLSAGAQAPMDYIFGRELVGNEPWIPGDIIQFTTCRFVDVQPHRTTTRDLGSPNHTAIIYSIQGRLVTLLQQNVNNDKHVQAETLNFASMVSGTLKVYQPVPRGGQQMSSAPQQMPPQQMPPQQMSQQQMPSPQDYVATGAQPAYGQQQVQQQQQPYAPSPIKQKSIKKPKTDSAHAQKNETHQNKKHKHGESDQADDNGPTAATPPDARVSPGPLYQERQELLRRIRVLQANGVEVYYYMQRFIDLDTRAAACHKQNITTATPDFSESLATLNQLLTIKETNNSAPPPPPMAQ